MHTFADDAIQSKNLRVGNLADVELTLRRYKKSERHA
jgi:hypothetical protein